MGGSGVPSNARLPEYEALLAKAQAGDAQAQAIIRGSKGWEQAAGGDVSGATDWLTGFGVDPKQAGTYANWVQSNPNVWAPQAPAVNPPASTTVLPSRPDLGRVNEGDPTAWGESSPTSYGQGPSEPQPAPTYLQQIQRPPMAVHQSSGMTRAADLPGVTWKDQQTALLENPQWGSLAQGVQQGTLEPGAAVKQAQALGAKPYEMDYWARLLGYNSGQPSTTGSFVGDNIVNDVGVPPSRTNPQQSGIVDWMSQARAGDQTAQYNLINSYGWQQAAQGNTNEAIDWLIRQGLDPKTASQAASWVQTNPNMWSGANATSAANATRDAFNLTNRNLSGAGQTTFPTDYVDQVVRAMLTGVPGPLSGGSTVGSGTIPWTAGTAPNVTSYGPGAGSMGLPGGQKLYETTGPGQVPGSGVGGGTPGSTNAPASNPPVATGPGGSQAQAQGAGGPSPGLWTPGPGGGQTFNPIGQGVPWWYRNNPPQLYWPNQATNQFPVWQNPWNPWQGGPGGPFGPGPTSSGSPGAGGTGGPGSSPGGVSGTGGYPAGIPPEVRASYGPEAFGNLYGPVSAPSTASGAGGGGEGGGGTGALTAGGSLASLASMGPYSGGIATPFGNFFGNTPGQNYGFSLTQGLGSGAFGQVVGAVMNSLGIPGAQAGNFLGNLAVSLAGTPFAGLVNSIIGVGSGTMQLSDAAQRANIYSLVPELAKFGLNIEDLAAMGTGRNSPLGQAFSDLSNPQTSLQANDAINAALGLGAGSLGLAGLSLSGLQGLAAALGLSPTTANIAALNTSGPKNAFDVINLVNQLRQQQNVSEVDPEVNLTPEDIAQIGLLGPPDPDPDPNAPDPSTPDPNTEGDAGTSGGGNATAGEGNTVGEYHTGGRIPNLGTRQLDSVPITAKEGEYVIRPRQARRFAPILEWINNAPATASTEQLMRFITMAKTMDQQRERVS